MKSLVASMTCLVALIALAGCRAPIPSLGSSELLAAFGSTRVPPPGTGSFATASRYNDATTSTTQSAELPNGWRTARQPSGTTTITPRDAGDTRLVPQVRASQSSDRFVSAGTSSVQPANFVTTSTVSSVGRTIGNGSSRMQLDGMHVNDATSPRAPGTLATSSNADTFPRGTSSRSTVSNVSSNGAASLSASSSNDALRWHRRGN